MRTGPAILSAALVSLLGLAALVPVLPLHDPTAIDMSAAFMPPGAAHLLGQDQYGRDVLSRLAWGARLSVTVALSSAFLAAIVGVALGLVGAYFRGMVETIAIRPMDILLCFPPLLLALLVITLTGPGVDTLIGVLALVFVPGFARVSYGAALSMRERDFVTAMRAIGASPLRIIVRTMLPNVAGQLLVQVSLAVAAAVILEAGLSFLGLGAVPPTPSWGLMIADARATMLQHPLLMVWPCLALTCTIFMVNLACDMLRDRIDPAPVSESIFGRPGAMAASASSTELLDIRDLAIAADGRRLVDDISFSVAPGEVHALIGASGSGKSLTSLAVIGLLDERLAVSGTVALDGHAVLELGEAGLRRLRGKTVAMVFQDPASGLNPSRKVGRQIADAVRVHRSLAGPALDEEVLALMRQVEIPQPQVTRHAYPHQLSGGQRQRVMIAMAIANAPRLLLADEPTTALDVTVQAQIMRTLMRLRSEKGMGILFVTHNLGLVAEYADRVSVMHAGKVVETGPVASVLASPQHDYTRQLIRNMPENLSRLASPHVMEAGHA